MEVEFVSPKFRRLTLELSKSLLFKEYPELARALNKALFDFWTQVKHYIRVVMLINRLTDVEEILPLELGSLFKTAAFPQVIEMSCRISIRKFFAYASERFDRIHTQDSNYEMEPVNHGFVTEKIGTLRQFSLKD